MSFIDLTSDEEESRSPTSLRDLCSLFDMPDPFLFPPVNAMIVETPESPVAGVKHPMDVCPPLGPAMSPCYYRDTDMRDTFFCIPDSAFDPLTIPGDVPPELDAVFPLFPACSCLVNHHSDDFMNDLKQRFTFLEQHCQARMTAVESLVNTFAVDLATLTHGVNQQLSRVCDLLQERYDANLNIHRHTGDVLASFASLPALDLRMMSGISREIQSLRRRTLYG